MELLVTFIVEILILFSYNHLPNLDMIWFELSKLVIAVFNVHTGSVIVSGEPDLAWKTKHERLYRTVHATWVRLLSNKPTHFLSIRANTPIRLPKMRNRARETRIVSRALTDLRGCFSAVTRRAISVDWDNRRENESLVSKKLNHENPFCAQMDTVDWDWEQRVVIYGILVEWNPEEWSWV